MLFPAALMQLWLHSLYAIAFSGKINKYIKRCRFLFDNIIEFIYVQQIILEQFVWLALLKNTLLKSNTHINLNIISISD